MAQALDLGQVANLWKLMQMHDPYPTILEQYMIRSCIGALHRSVWIMHWAGIDASDASLPSIILHSPIGRIALSRLDLEWSCIVPGERESG